MALLWPRPLPACGHTPPQDVSRSSISHNGVVVANGFMHCGTTADTFLRENLEWLKKATNWAKFTATASLGVIHQVRAEGGPQHKLQSELLPPLPSL